MKTTVFQLGDSGKLEPVSQTPIVEVRQIVFLNGYGQTVHSHERLAVYKIETSDFGVKYHCVNLDKPSLCVKDHIEPVENLFGIGTYFIVGDIATQEEIDDVLPMAQAAEQMRQNKQAAEQRAGDERRAQAKKWWADNTPSWAKGYIVAELKVDKSDSMTDYFHASTSKTLLLSWSSTDRLNFAEMRKAGEGIPEIENLAELKEDRYHRILGNYYHGWTIKKCRIGGFNGYNDDFVSDPENIRLQKVANEPTGDKIALCKLNTAKGGIEIYFNSKPAQSVIDDLKANGFRWGKFNKCWYKIDTTSARSVASKYATIPEDRCRE